MIHVYHGVRDGSFTLSTFVKAWSFEFSNKLIMRKEDKKQDKKDRIWTGVLLDGSSTLSRKTKQQFLFFMYLFGIGSTLSCLEEERARRIIFISIMVVGHFFCGERKFMSNASDRIYLFSRPRSLQPPFLSLGKTFLLFLFSKNYLYELKKQRKKSINKLSSVWLLRAN